MVRRGPQSLVKALAMLYPALPDHERVIEQGQVSVDGRVVRNPASMVGPGSHVALITPSALRGEAKLQAALSSFDVLVQGRVALDAGAAAGGFTKVLLDRGAARVFAVDVGHGQLLGSLRQDPRVINLEATNLAELNSAVVPDQIDVVTLDLSYLSLADAVPQLERISVSPHADLIALVKPMFELHLPQPPNDQPTLEKALVEAMKGIQTAGWTVVSSIESPVRGSRGAFEYLVHARYGRVKHSTNLRTGVPGCRDIPRTLQQMRDPTSTWAPSPVQTSNADRGAPC